MHQSKTETARCSRGNGRSKLLDVQHEVTVIELEVFWQTRSPSLSWKTLHSTARRDKHNITTHPELRLKRSRTLRRLQAITGCLAEQSHNLVEDRSLYKTKDMSA